MESIRELLSNIPEAAATDSGSALVGRLELLWHSGLSGICHTVGTPREAIEIASLLFGLYAVLTKNEKLTLMAGGEENFHRLVEEELSRARFLHPEPFGSRDTCLGVIKEELVELEDAIFFGIGKSEVDEPHENRPSQSKMILEEAVQVGAMCIRGWEELLAKE